MSDAAASVRERLLAAGVPAAEVDAAEREGSLALLAFEAALLPGFGRFTAAQAAAATGLSLEQARRLRRAMGFPDAVDDEPAYNSHDIEALRWAAEITEPEVFEAVVELTRVMASSLTRVAEAWSDLMLPFLLGDETDDTVRADLVLRAFDADLPRRLIDFVARRQFYSSLGRHLSAPHATAGRTTAVAFADLVGFTALSQQIGEQDLARVVGQFEARAHDLVAARGGRVVKMIGDEVMFVADDLRTAAMICLDLVERLGPEGLPPARAGLACGGVLAREGDYFGPVVNVASRLVTIAPPGGVLMAGDAADTLADEATIACRPAGQRDLKDIGITAVYELTRR